METHVLLGVRIVKHKTSQNHIFFWMFGGDFQREEGETLVTHQPPES